jgi:hypothetical protein
MRFVLAAVLAAHGVAHLVGFVSSWKLATLAELPYKTTVFAGRFDLGDAGIRVYGALWLLAAVAMWIAAIAIGTAASGAMRLTMFALVASLALCIAGWPDSRIGVAVNVAFLIFLIVGDRIGMPVAP